MAEQLSAQLQHPWILGMYASPIRLNPLSEESLWLLFLHYIRMAEPRSRWDQTSCGPDLCWTDGDLEPCRGKMTCPRSWQPMTDWARIEPWFFDSVFSIVLFHLLKEIQAILKSTSNAMPYKEITREGREFFSHPFKMFVTTISKVGHVQK